MPHAPSPMRCAPQSSVQRQAPDDERLHAVVLPSIYFGAATPTQVESVIVTYGIPLSDCSPYVVSMYSLEPVSLAGDGPCVSTEAAGSAQPFRFFVVPPGGIEPPSTG